MSTRPVTLHEERAATTTPEDCCRFLRSAGSCSLFLDGRGGFSESWITGPMVAFEPRLLVASNGEPGSIEGLLQAIDRRVVERRRAVGASRYTGLALLLSYEALDPTSRELASLVALEVDASLRFDPSAPRVTATVRDAAADAAIRKLERLQQALQRCSQPGPQRLEPARASSPVRTSLPRQTYLAGVEQVRGHIERGDIYQANLTQRFSGAYRGDELERYLALSGEAVAPHSAFVETGSVTVASISPETFLRSSRDGEIETWPIKGTRPRGHDLDADRAAAAELLASEKDRAELLMIVDLERNDLSRISVPGSVRVSQIAGLRSYPRVHHLVAGIHGRMRRGTGIGQLLRATFPGGSITGAPKLRAMEIIDEIEPERRGYFTGSLFWFGDDGSLDSSILIRTLVFRDGRFELGAGGGIVADSDPQSEWLESNHKARVLARSLGFDPTEAR